MRIILAGGGTGGHLMPGIALAQRITKQHDDPRVLFLASTRETDVRTLSRYELEAVHLPTVPLGANPAGWPKFVWGGLKVIARAHKMIAAFGADAAVGLGGYTSFFPLVAARLQGVPIVLLEQNVVPGKATRWLAPLANEIVCQWQETVRYFGVKITTRALGNPIREEILTGSREQAIERLHLNPGKKTLLVTGGSQGARPLNEMMIRCAPHLSAAEADLQVIHLSGHADREAVAEAYRKAGITAETVAFLDDMGLAYGAADFALSRAGGTTIAELTACGLPAILVPYPHAADQHQLHNARSVAQADAAVLLQQEDFSPERLVGMICTFIRDPKLLRRMRTASLALGRPNATESILETLRSYAQAQPVSKAVEALRPESMVEKHT